MKTDKALSENREKGWARSVVEQATWQKDWGGPLPHVGSVIVGYLNQIQRTLRPKQTESLTGGEQEMFEDVWRSCMMHDVQLRFSMHSRTLGMLHCCTLRCAACAEGPAHEVAFWEMSLCGHRISSGCDSVQVLFSTEIQGERGKRQLRSDVMRSKMVRRVMFWPLLAANLWYWGACHPQKPIWFDFSSESVPFSAQCQAAPAPEPEKPAEKKSEVEKDTCTAKQDKTGGPWITMDLSDPVENIQICIDLEIQWDTEIKSIKIWWK